MMASCPPVWLAVISVSGTTLVSPLLCGNGWDNPVVGMTDSSNSEHNKKNRRVEVKVFALEKE